MPMLFRPWLCRALIAMPARLFGAPPAPVAAGVAGGIDLLELHPATDENHLVMESTFTLGEGSKTFALKVDGGSDTRVAFDHVQVQGLWMPEVAPGATLALGVRHDFREGANLTHAVAGVEVELTPWLSGEHYVYLSQHGDLTGGAKFVARFPLPHATTLEPRVQLGWSARAIPAEDLAAGLTDVQASLRVRHTVDRHVDVYVGVIHERLLGGTAGIARVGGDPARITRAVIGAGFSL